MDKPGPRCRCSVYSAETISPRWGYSCFTCRARDSSGTVTGFPDHEYQRLQTANYLYESRFMGYLRPISAEEHYYHKWRKYLASYRSPQVRPMPKRALRELALHAKSESPRFSSKSAWGLLNRLMKVRSVLLDLVLRGKLD